jgi:hypothetical protein
MGLNKYQTAAAKTYGGGMFAHIAAIEDDAELQLAIDNTYDIAFQDMMAALGSPECDSREKAVELLKAAIDGARMVTDMAYGSAPAMAM